MQDQSLLESVLTPKSQDDAWSDPGSGPDADDTDDDVRCPAMPTMIDFAQLYMETAGIDRKHFVPPNGSQTFSRKQS